MDIDEYEIGKNYPVASGVVADAAAFCDTLWALVRDEPADVTRRRDSEERVARLMGLWNARTAPGRTDRTLPLRISALLDVLRGVLPDETIVVTSAGHPQAQFLQEYPVTQSLGSISSNGFSTMGFTLPGALGAKLAAPDRPVIGLAGDGDFLMTVQELATAAQYSIPVVYIVANNAGWQSIRTYSAPPMATSAPWPPSSGHPPASPASPTWSPSPAGSASLPSGPATRSRSGAQWDARSRPMARWSSRSRYAASSPISAGLTSGWWDVPVPASLDARRQRYESEVASVRHDPIRTGEH